MQGQRVGHVRIESALGTGGMGQVYLGWDEWLERKVAVKALRTEKIHGSNAVARLRREARLLSRLDHPNVCRIYDLVEFQGRDLLLLEYIEGETLSDAASWELGRDQKLRIGEEIALALAAAHRQNIIHRDLKPENVMVTAEGSVKVLDFGIALPTELGQDKERDPAARSAIDPAMQSLPETISYAADSGGGGQPKGQDSSSKDHEEPRTHEGAIVGTLLYMSPEQAQGREIDQASDLYSLGILLQELFTGERAYRSRKQVVDALLQVATGQTRPILDIDPELTTLLEDLLAIDPESRPTAARVAESLANLRERPERQRKIRRMGLVALAVLAIVIATVALTYRVASPRPLLATGEIARVAVLPFVNSTGDSSYDWAESGLSEIVIGILDAAEEIRVFPSDRIRERLTRRGLEIDHAWTPEQMERLSKDFGVSAMIATRLEKDEVGFLLISTILTRDGRQEEVRVLTSHPLEGADRLAAGLATRFDPASLVPEIEESLSFDAFANQAFAMGMHELRTSGPQTALPYFEISLARDTTFLQADLQRAHMRFRLGEFDQAQLDFQRIILEAKDRNDSKAHAKALVHSAAVAHERGDLEDAEKLYLAALEIQQSEGDEEIRAITQTRLAWIHFRRGELDRAEAVLEESLDLVKKLDLREQLPIALTPWAYVALRRGDLEQAEKRFRKAHDLAVEMGNQDLEAGASLNLGSLLLKKGELEEALEQVDLAHEAFEAMGVQKGVLVAQINRGAILGELERWSGALEASRAAVSLAQEIGDGRSEVFALAAVGYFETRMGRLGEAEIAFQGARNADWDRDDVDLAWQIEIDEAYLETRRGRLGAARRHLKAAEELKADPLNLRIAARLAYAEGDFAKAAELDQLNREARAQALWTPSRQAISETYRRSSERGRPAQLPDELPIAHEDVSNGAAKRGQR